MYKKGFATALVDFYATVIIVLIIIIFFVVLHFTGENVTFSIQDAEDTYSLETTQIALLYAQTPVETSQGTMTLGKFLPLVAQDPSWEAEFRDATKRFLDTYCPNTIGKQLSIQIVLTQNGEEKQLQSDLACTDEELSSEWIVRSSSDIMIPLQKPGDFGTITISTLEKVSLNPFTYSMPYSEETK